VGDEVEKSPYWNLLGFSPDIHKGKVEHVDGKCARVKWDDRDDQVDYYNYGDKTGKDDDEPDVECQIQLVKPCGPELVEGDIVKPGPDWEEEAESATVTGTVVKFLKPKNEKFLKPKIEEGEIVLVKWESDDDTDDEKTFDFKVRNGYIRRHYLYGAHQPGARDNAGNARCQIQLVATTSTKSTTAVPTTTKTTTSTTTSTTISTTSTTSATSKTSTKSTTAGPCKPGCKALFALEEHKDYFCTEEGFECTGCPTCAHILL